ncbi:MAG: hypothetical protein IT423_12455 [Pirellulaceae bacterium]|nr:hypothetical protein [Pirellulaceae bacterium]
MTSSLSTIDHGSDGPRNRAVLILSLAGWSTLGLLSAAIFGCQSPLRSWRKDDPSLRELMVSSRSQDHSSADRDDQRPSDRQPSDRQPSDRQLSDGEEDQHDQLSNRSKSSRASGSRANPYAASSMAQRDRRPGADPSLAEESQDDQAYDDSVADAQWEAALEQADPALRGLIKKQWQTYRQQAAAKARQYEEQYADSAEQTSGAAVFRLSDEDEDEAEAGSLSSPGKSSLPNRMAKTATAASQNPKKPSAAARLSLSDERYDEPLGDEPNDDVAFEHGDDDSLGDDGLSNGVYGVEAANSAVRSPTNRRHPQELKPPAATRTSRQVAHAPAVDTGAGDEVRIMPIQRTARDANPMASLPNASKREAQPSPKQLPQYSENPQESQESYVTPASAGPRSPSSVQPASVQPASVQPASVQPSPSDAPSALPERTHDDALHEALRLIDQTLQKSTSDSPTEQLRLQVAQRNLHVLLGQLEPALKPIDGLQAHEQEYFRHKMQSLYNAIDVNGNPVLARRWPLVLDSDREGMSHLSAISNLEIKNAAFCSNVDGFGAITKFPTTQFRANQELLLYCEIDNFVSEPVKDGFETKLQGNYEIVDANNVRVADVLLPQEVDVCKRPRRDYFFVYRIYMPQKIEPGRYQMRLTIEDMKGRKFGQTAVDFQVAL